MANERNNTNNKLVLMNDKIFSFVYIAGTNVKKFIQQTGKHNQLTNIREVSEFVLRLVESRNLPLEVNAKIVCGMGRILLHRLQNILADVLTIQQECTLDRRIGYGEKNVVRNVKIHLKRKTDGKNNDTAVPLDLDFEVVNYDVDIQEQITEKEVIFSLVSPQNATVVKNVEDITMRDEPHMDNYSTQLQLTEDNDFGETMPNEMLDFFHDSNDESLADTAVPFSPGPASLEDMDIDLSVDADVDMENNSSYTEHQILPLEDALLPLSMEAFVYDQDVPTLQPNATNDDVEVSMHEENDEIISNNPPTDDDIEQEETQMERKRQLVIDTCTQISTKCYNRSISNWSTVYCKKQKLGLQELIAEIKLNNLFTKPLRDCCNRSKFDRKFPLSGKRNRCFDFDVDFCNKKPQHKKQITVCDEPPDQKGDEQQDATDLPSIQSSDESHFATPVPANAPGMADFLTCFTGNQSQWDYLKSCEPSSSEGDKQQKNNEGVVTRYAIKTLLDSMFAGVTNDSVPFKLLQAKMGNRLIAVSLFAKLLELSKEKIIRVSTDENGSPVSVHKYTNWE